MSRTVGIGIQDFKTIISNNYFYIDKTGFIKEWWESGDSVTLITRPRRFGKTLTMSMTELFFSLKCAEQSSLFESLSIWKEKKYRDLQGTYPVISLSFANVKETDYLSAKERICQLITDLYIQNSFLRDSDVLTEKDKEFFDLISRDMPDTIATIAIHKMSDFLYRYYGKKVIILLDEYDTPMQEAYVSGFWNKLAAFTRSLFNSMFKTNPWLERGIMTGITRISKESIFSDLNNLKVVTTTSDEYASAFGFTEQEVFNAMDEFDVTQKDKVKFWYDGFTFGNIKDIYNPWSILNFLDTKKLTTYWADTSSNSLVNKLIRESGSSIKKRFESLLAGEPIITDIDEQLVYNELDNNEEAIWSLLLAGGYLKVQRYKGYSGAAWVSEDTQEYELVLTNYEVRLMFERMIKSWFKPASDYNDFVNALLSDDLDAMNEYINRVSEEIFSSFDTGRRNSNRTEPERFYHGFVLGLIVELKSKYVITSNRESGFGRYDVMLKPEDKSQNGIIIEFKVFNPRKDKTLQDTVQAALQQIEDKNYAAELVADGIPKKNICKYGFAFKGKKVLIEKQP